MQKKWTENVESLEQTFVFGNFQEALNFVNRVGEIAEKMNHHPDICIKNYKQVSISTTTHDKGNTLTKKDYELAEAVDKLV